MKASEMLLLISKQWCSIDDLMKIAQIGRNKAFKIKRNIVDELKENGYFIKSNLIPMKAVVDYLSIDISYLEVVSRERK